MAPVRIMHVADVHLDPTFRYLGPKERERRRDFLSAFNYVVRKVLELKPDALLVAGDLYDRVNPRNPARVQVIRAFRRIHSEGVRIFVIGGNHDTPRSVEEGASPLHELDAAGYARFFSKVSEADAETFEVEGYRVCVSGASYNHALLCEVDPLEVIKLPSEGDVNIAMLHYNYAPARVPPMWRAPTIKETSVPRDIHYLALGHYHRRYEARVGITHVVYPGGTERRTFAEEGEPKGFAYVELSEEGVQKLSFIETRPRPLKTVEVTLTERTLDPVREVVERAIKYSEPEAILRLRIKGRLPLDKLTRYSRDEILERVEGSFFHVVVEDRGLEYALELPELEGVEELSPLRLYEEYLGAFIEREGDESKKRLLEEALRVGRRLLEEVGAW